MLDGRVSKDEIDRLRAELERIQGAGQGRIRQEGLERGFAPPIQAQNVGIVPSINDSLRNGHLGGAVF